MMMDMKLGKNNKKLGCMSFVKTEGFIPSYDLDQLYSMAIENFDRAEEQDSIEKQWQIQKNKEGDDPVASLLPILMTSFFIDNGLRAGKKVPEFNNENLQLEGRVFTKFETLLSDL